MKSQKRFLLIVLCAVVAICSTFLFASCGIFGGLGNNDGTGGDKPGEETCQHIYGEWVEKTPSTCYSEGLQERECSLCGNKEEENIPMLAHNFGTYESNGDATCMADGTKTAHCTNEGCSQTDTVKDVGTKTRHNLVLDSVIDATCLTHGSEIKKCSTEGCDYTVTVTLPALGHSWDHEASCTEGRSCSECDATLPALGHNYVLSGTVERDCEHDGKLYYRCDRCGDTYEEITEQATGHNVQTWTKSDSPAVLAATDSCKENITYHGQCETCGQTISKTERVDRHNLKASIKTPATCKTDGVMLYSCDRCGYTNEESYKDMNAHTYGYKVDGKVTTYTCEHCGDSYRVISAKDLTETAVSVADLKEVGGVELKNASISLDDNAKQVLDGATNVSVAAQAINSDDLNLTEEQRGQIETVYEFTIQADNTKVTDFGGKVTVKLPYTLSDGEDPECIAIWYINNEGELEAYQATYANGFVTFETDHFSKYTVTRLTPAQRCDLYGHSYYITEVPTNCVTDGYILKVCQRCAHTERKELGSATGHKIVAKPQSVATCITDGSVVYECTNDGCEYRYTKKLPARGHDWVANPATSVSATCEHSGHTDYKCSRCNETYIQTMAQKQHSYKTEIVAPTCTDEGYTLYTCTMCGKNYKDNYKSATGHNYVETVVAPTCTEEGYTRHTCTGCDEYYDTDKVAACHTWDIDEPTCGKGQTCLLCGESGKPATGNHNMQNGVCTVCGQGCEHSFTEEIIAPTCTEKGYKVSTCSNCKTTVKSDYVPALGHEGVLECSRCHSKLVNEQFFVNGFSSLVTNDFVIRLNDVEFSVSGYAYEFDFAEVILTVDGNGKLKGYASGTAVGSSDDYPELETVSAQAIIKNDYIYIKLTMPMSYGTAGGSEYGMEYNSESSTQYIMIPLTGSVSIEEVQNDQDSITAIASVITVLKQRIMPFINSLALIHGEETDKALSTVASQFFTVEKSGSGYVLSVNMSALKTLNDNLYEHTIKENVEILFGEGAYKKITDSVITLLDKTVGELIVEALKEEITVEEIQGIVDAVIKIVTGGETGDLTGGTDITDILADEELRNTKILDIINMALEGESEPLTIKFITEQCEVVGEYIAYDLIADLTMPKEELKELVDYYCNYLDCGSIDFTTDAIGNVLQIGLSVDNLEVLISEDETFKLNGKLTFTTGVAVTGDYSSVENELPELFGKIELTGEVIEQLYPEMTVKTYENGKVKSMQGEEVEETVISERDYGKNIIRTVRVTTKEINISFVEEPMIILVADCGNWYSVQISAEGVITTTTEMVERYIVDGNVVKENRFNQGSWNTTGSFNYYYNAVSQKAEIIQNNYGHSQKHNYVEDKNLYKPNGDGCLDWGERHYSCTECGQSYTYYFAKGHTYAYKYEFLTDERNCEAGVKITNYCSVCNEEFYTNEIYDHMTYVVEKVDLSGCAGVCERHKLELFTCPCEAHKHLSYDLKHINNTWNEGTQIDTYGCDECGLTLRIVRTDSRNPETCLVTETSVYTVSYNDSEIETYDFVDTYYSHYFDTYVSLKPGAKTCEDGVLVTRICRACGHSEEGKEEHDHVYGVVQAIDLKEYGAACGEKLKIYGCACGAEKRRVEISNGDHINHDWENVEPFGKYNEIRVYKCAVSDPVQCTLTYAFAFYNERCDRYYDVLIGCDDQGKNEKKVVEHAYYGSNHQFGEPLELENLGECRYRMQHTCTVCGYSEEFITLIHNHDVVKEATCSQYGVMRCVRCGDIQYIMPDHQWYFNEEDGLYHCDRCDITNTNGANGSVILENCTEQLGNGENYVVGYFLKEFNFEDQNRYNELYLLTVTLILDEPLEDGNDQIIVNVMPQWLEGVDGNYVYFSKAEVEEWATNWTMETGYKGNYNVRLSFVPRHSSGMYDYGITFD